MTFSQRSVFLSAWVVVLLCYLPRGATAASICSTVNASATSIVFGNYSAGATLPAESNGTINVTCSQPGNHELPSFTAALSAGAMGNFNPRQMSGGGANLSYNIYTNSSYSAIWGDGTSGTSTESYSQSSGQTALTFTAYGRIPVAQFVAAGVYTDSITVTITY
jgi:spore coat protein U-like protein